MQPGLMRSARLLQAHQERAYCAANFLSAGTLAMIDGMRQQLLGELTGRRLVRSLGDASTAAGDTGLVRCVLVSRGACWSSFPVLPSLGVHL